MRKAVRHRCPTCGGLNEVVSKPGDYLGLTTCYKCHSSFFANKDTRVEVLTPGKEVPDQHRRSHDQERRASKRDGARLQAASGAMDHVKGDVRKPGLYLKECKCTIHKSYAIERSVLDKIVLEAKPGEVPVLEVEFQGQYPKQRFYIIPEWAFEEYMEMRQHANKNPRGA